MKDISMMLGGDSDEVRRMRRWTITSCILHVIIGILSNGSDWLFYVELNATEKGLVYGPVDENILNALLAFCIIGCLIFLADLLCHVYSHCFCLKKWEKCINNPHLISILAVLFGDIPQVSIRICVARCREQGLSYLQIAKTTLVFLGESVYDDTRTWKIRADQIREFVCLCVCGKRTKLFFCCRLHFLLTV